MKNILLLVLVNTVTITMLQAQNTTPSKNQRAALQSLIDQYSQARENRDTVLLKKILTTGIDQLVSTGEWRNGIRPSLQGMLSSSASSPGTRTLTIEKMRLLNSGSALVDCKYEILNADGTTRKMWSTFIAVLEKGEWKITAIRNMLPAGQ